MVDYNEDSLKDHGLFSLSGLDFIEDASPPKSRPTKVAPEPAKPQREADDILETFFEIASDERPEKELPTASTWDSFNTDIRDYLLLVTPQSEREETRNEKLVSFFFLDKGSKFTDRYIEQKSNNVYDPNSAGCILSMDYLLTCLKSLVCGHQSSLFTLHEKRRVFTISSANVKFKVSGLTTTSIASIMDFCLVAGSLLERLKYTSRVIYKNAISAGPILVAFANCINIITEVVANYVNESTTSGFIDFYNMIYTPVNVVTMLAELLGCDDLTKALALNRLPQSWKLLNSLYARCVMLESANEKLYQLVKLVLKSVADQWFDKLENFIGLGEQFSQFWRDLDEKKTSDFFTKVTSDLGIHLFSVDQEKVPDFFDMHLAEKSVDIMNCLLLLAQYSNENVMLNLQELKKVKIKWRTGTDLQKDILRYQADAVNVFESVLENALITPYENNMELVTEMPLSIKQKCMDTISAMDDMIPFFAKLSLDEYKDPDSLKSICYSLFTSIPGTSSLQTPIEAATNVAVSDLISIQSWLMNSLALKVVFNHGERRLLDHMVLIRNIMLLGSGALVFDLENMIFGSLNNTRVPLISSLNLGVYGQDPGRRLQWPPSTAETNRALPHCVESAILGLSGTQAPNEVLARDYINFGMRTPRNFSGDCQNLDATGLFFLVYNPPDPLSVVITKDVTKQYNRVFARLLQIMHVKHAAKQLFMKSMQRRKRGNELLQADDTICPDSIAVSQSIQFLNTTGNHFSSVVIDYIWKPWAQYLETKVFQETSILNESMEHPVVGLSELISRHQKVAADMSTCFFNTKETISISRSIDRVLGYILRLAKLILNSPQGDIQDIRKVEIDIHDAIVAFIGHLSERTESNEIESVLSRLLLTQLTSSGFYAT